MSTYIISDSCQKIKATRTSAPKSRTGCIVCKARRIKCDEKKPSCKACVKSGHQCQYGSPKTVAKKARIILPQNDSTLSQARPSQALKFLDQREIYYFWAYQEEAAQELSGVLNSSAWTRTMLQACHTEPFVLRSVVAIGAINKSVKMSYEASLSTAHLRDAHQQISNQHREFALSAYDKAISGMRQIELDRDGPSSPRKALMACLLVHCLEIYLGSPNTGFTQSHAGYNLLLQWRENNNRPDAGIASPDPTVIEDELFHEISRLDTQNALMLGQHGLERHAERRLEASEVVRDMPLKFGSLDEARAYQELIVRRSTHLLGETYARIMVAKLEYAHPHTADSPGELVDPCYLPTKLLGERDAYMKDIRRWCQAFQPIFGALVASPDPKTAVGASMLMIHALHSEISLAGAFFCEECSFDAFLPHFREIVYLSRLVSQRNEEIFSRDLPSFQLSPGTAWCLYELVTICRDADLRQEALSILRYQAEHDATRYKARLVIHAMYLVGLEEQGRREDGGLPESARYRRLGMLYSFEDESSSITFLCPRKLGYPLGKAYPAKREWKKRTVSAIETANMTLGDTVDLPVTQPWPAAVPKPNFLKWKEVHRELLELTMRLG